MSMIIEMILSAIMAIIGQSFAPLGPAPTMVDPIPSVETTLFGNIRGCIVGGYCDTPESADDHIGGLWPQCGAEDDSNCVFLDPDGDYWASLGDGTFVFVHIWEDMSFRSIENNRPSWVHPDWRGPIPTHPIPCDTDANCAELNPWIDPNNAGY